MKISQELFNDRALIVPESLAKEVTTFEKDRFLSGIGPAFFSLLPGKLTFAL